MFNPRKFLYSTIILPILLLSACAQPLEDSKLIPVEEEIAASVSSIEEVNITSGTAGEVTIVTVSTRILYKDIKLFDPQHVSTIMSILENNWAGLRASEKTLDVSFIQPEAEKGAYGAKYGQSLSYVIRDSYNVFKDKLVAYSDGPNGRIRCLEMDGVIYRLSSGDSMDVSDYSSGGNEICLNGISTGRYIEFNG